MPKILICYVKAGLGHASNAKALKQKLNDTYKNLDVELYDVLENSKLSFLDGFFNSAYIRLVNNLPFLWLCLINIARVKPVAIAFKFVFNRSIRSKLRKKIWHFEPDMVVSTYYFIADAVSTNVRKSSKSMSIVTLVTDTFSPHSIWFRVNGGQFIVSSQEAYFIGKKYLKDSSRIKRFGYVFNENYNTRFSSTQNSLLKVRFGLNKALKTVLILGGGGGLKGAESIYKELYRKRKDLNIIIVCGMNKKQYSFFQKNTKSHENTKVFGFTECVKELISVSDAVISKSGPATVLEVLSQGKKIFLNSYIPDQEKGNMDFVVDNQFGYYSEDTKDLVSNCINYLNDKYEQNKFKLNLKKHKIISEVSSVVEFIYQKSKKNIPYSDRFKK